MFLKIYRQYLVVPGVAAYGRALPWFILLDEVDLKWKNIDTESKAAQKVCQLLFDEKHKEAAEAAQSLPEIQVYRVWANSFLDANPAEERKYWTNDQDLSNWPTWARFQQMKGE